MIHLKVNNLGKAYKRYPNKWLRILEWLSPGKVNYHEKHWVLRGVSFEVRAGEAIGLIGSNGAGKSTLLKIITGTTQATEGTVEVNGGIAALLELGMGFHPDFTGRENVFTTGQLLGLSDQDIRAKMPEIEAFAEIGDYIDQPLRTYSSGMQVRLAFSIATAVRPDILIVDEALSVGDAYFQHKSFDRIRQFKAQGTTLLFVSHSPGAIKTLCNRAILLDHGAVIRDGEPDEVLDYYNALIAKREADYKIQQVEDQIGQHRATRSGTQAAIITSVDALQEDESVRAFLIGSPATFRIAISVCADMPELTVGILFRDQLGNDIFGTNTYHLDSQRRNLKAGQQLQFDFCFPELNLGVGTYSVSIALHSKDSHIKDNYDWWDRALVFQMVPGNGPAAIGVSYLKVNGVWSQRTISLHDRKQQSRN